MLLATVGSETVPVLSPGSMAALVALLLLAGAVAARRTPRAGATPG